MASKMKKKGYTLSIPDKGFDVENFKLYCSRKEYYLCKIFSSKKEMQKWNEEDGYKTTSDYQGVCRQVDYFIVKGNKCKKSSQIGTISFYIDRIGSGIVSHEMTHAALFWFKNKFRSYSKLGIKKNDEKVCYAQGHMVMQFWNHWYELIKIGRIKKIKRNYAFKKRIK